GMASPSSYMTALMEQTADGIDKLQRTLKQSEGSRHKEVDAMLAVSETLAGLSDRLDAQAQQASKSEDANKVLADAIAQLAQAASKPEAPAAPAMDDATKQHIRNLDVGIKRLIEEQSRSTEMLADELRGELKLLSRTIAAGLDNRGGRADEVSNS
ncbi:MAG: hypothetical protein AB3N28_12225, partial [Kordiimonas sp.]